MISLAERNIRATSFAEGPPAAPDELLTAYINKVKTSVHLGRPIRLDFILGVDSQNRVSSEKKERVIHRFRLFQENGIQKQAHYHLVPAIAGLEILIVDNVHMIIGVPYRGVVEGFKYGLLFSNSPEIINEFVDWFDQALRGIATPLLRPEDLQS